MFITILICVFDYLVIIAGAKSVFHRYWFNTGQKTTWDTLGDDASSWFAGVFWPIFIILFGVKKLSDLIEKEWEDK